MNHLAHLYLSGPDPDILLGNFMADSVKGKQLEHYPTMVQAGIRLHRAIDTYTDAHPVVRQSKARLYPGYSKFAGVITDMFYDHFLAVSWASYHSQPLSEFVDQFYTLLTTRMAEVPEKVQYFAPYMISQNWLLRYAEIEGIGRSLYGLSQRVKNAEKLQFAVLDLEKDFDLYREEFELFFPDLRRFAAEKLIELTIDKA